MYSEMPYSFIPHGTTQGLVFMVSLSESVTATDDISFQIAKLITLLDGITVTDSVSATNERVLTFTSKVKGFKITSKVKGFRITSSITAKKNE
jgi:hypothetical protein